MVRLIGSSGAHIGEKTVPEALVLAHAEGLDLVEIVANVKPPVCKIMDFGKFKYNQKKKERKAQTHSARTDLKEIRLRTKIEAHDFGIKMMRIKQFLTKGHRVKLTVTFRGREITRVEMGHKLIERARLALAAEGKVLQGAELEGRSLSVMVDPIR